MYFSEFRFRIPKLERIPGNRFSKAEFSKPKQKKSKLKPKLSSEPRLRLFNPDPTRDPVGPPPRPARWFPDRCRAGSHDQPHSNGQLFEEVGEARDTSSGESTSSGDTILGRADGGGRRVPFVVSGDIQL